MQADVLTMTSRVAHTGTLPVVGAVCKHANQQTCDAYHTVTVRTQGECCGVTEDRGSDVGSQKTEEYCGVTEDGGSAVGSQKTGGVLWGHRRHGECCGGSQRDRGSAVGVTEDGGVL